MQLYEITSKVKQTKPTKLFETNLYGIIEKWKVYENKIMYLQTFDSNTMQPIKCYLIFSMTSIWDIKNGDLKGLRSVQIHIIYILALTNY